MTDTNIVYQLLFFSFFLFASKLCNLLVYRPCTSGSVVVGEGGGGGGVREEMWGEGEGGGPGEERHFSYIP